MICSRCAERGKDWEGSDPKCAFLNMHFSEDNWNCATMSSLRSLLHLSITWSEDQNVGVLGLDGDFLILSWYKSRGRTDGAWIVSSSNMTVLTVDEAEKILKGTY